MARRRRLKDLVHDALTADDPGGRLSALLDEHPPIGLIGPLFSFILNRSALARWRAVDGFGPVLSRIMADEPEQARNVMRRFLWHMNEESANVPWGIAEAMAAAMAAQPILADEYHKKLGSYIQEEVPGHESNYLQYAGMREGVYWGLMRLSETRPDLVKRFIPDLLKALDKEEDAASIGYIALTFKNMGDRSADEKLAGFADEPDRFELWRGGELQVVVLGDVVKEALAG